jgi:tetratricopeptide (TPR) repeat protein
MNPLEHLVSVACLLLAASSAQAKDADAKERAAKVACLAGDYAKGVALLSELYVTTNDPVYVYNQGRCFQQNHHYEDAISRFQEYLRVGKQISRTDKADAQKHVADCKELLGQQGGSPLAPAEAGRGDSKTAKERAAKKACLSGDSDAGVAILTDLYVDTNDVNYIFNQGRCLEQSERCAEAIVRFHEYQRKTKDADIASDGRAERHIADCEEFLKRAKDGERPSPSADASSPRRGSAASTALGRATDSHGPSSAGPGQEAMEASHAQAGVQASLPQTSPGRVLRIAGEVTFAVGVAGVAAGLGFALAANHLTDELEAKPARYQPSKESSQANYATSSRVSYVAGAACLAGGALFYYLGWRKGREFSATLEPMVSAQSAGALVQVAF